MPDLIGRNTSIAEFDWFGWAIGTKCFFERTHVPSSGHTLATENVIAHDVEVIEGNMSEMRAAGTFTHGPDIEKERQQSFCPSFAFCARNLAFPEMKCVKTQSRPSGH